MIDPSAPIVPHPTASDFDVFISDLNGQLRGKRLPITSLGKILNDGIKMPRSVVGVDFWGDDVIDSGLVFETGDSDGVCRAVPSTLAPVTWDKQPRQQLIAMMTNPDGSAFEADPRQALLTIVDKYQALGLTPVVATEMEFYLFDIASLQEKYPLVSPLMPQDVDFERNDVYSISELDDFHQILREIREVCEHQGVPADTITAEMGMGQFELNLIHEPDPLSAGDHAVMFKRIVKAIARKHGHLASFMAKPDGTKSGNGLHVHFSILDHKGRNLFDDGTPKGSEIMYHAIGGLIECMADHMLIFAPHINSYRRFTPDTHAPVVANWGYENRTAAVRIPESPNEARRIEHRVSGADANPYLVLAAILGAALYGIEHKIEPPEPTVGDTQTSEAQFIDLPIEWADAIEEFRTSPLNKTVLNPLLVDVFTALKLQEFDKFKSRVTDAEYETYLGVV